VETVINRPRQFRILRPVVDRRGRRRVRWMPMSKGIFNLWRFVELGEQANRRYLDALAQVQAKSQAVDELDALCLSREHANASDLHPRRRSTNDLSPQVVWSVAKSQSDSHQCRGRTSRCPPRELHGGGSSGRRCR